MEVDRTGKHLFVNYAGLFGYTKLDVYATNYAVAIPSVPEPSTGVIYGLGLILAAVRVVNRRSRMRSTLESIPQ